MSASTRKALMTTKRKITTGKNNNTKSQFFTKFSKNNIKSRKSHSNKLSDKNAENTN